MIWNLLYFYPHIELSHHFVDCVLSQNIIIIEGTTFIIMNVTNFAPTKLKRNQIYLGVTCGRTRSLLHFEPFGEEHDQLFFPYYIQLTGRRHEQIVNYSNLYTLYAGRRLGVGKWTCKLRSQILAQYFPRRRLGNGVDEEHLADPLVEHHLYIIRRHPK